MRKIIVLGGTGYIANRLVPTLVNKGYHIKVSYRDKRKINTNWVNHPKIEFVFADTFDKNSLINALKF